MLNSVQVPQFPDSEWTNLIAGWAVDLDHVLSGTHTIAHEQHITEQVGGIQVSTGSRKPSKTVKTHGDWVIAWNNASEVIVHLFEHCHGELNKYTKCINQLFATYPVDQHWHVIQFD